MAYVRCSEALHKKIRVAAAAREISMQDLVEIAVETELSGQTPAKNHSTGTAKPVVGKQGMVKSDQEVLKHTSCTPQELALVELLLTVLRSPKPHLSDAIRFNLEQFADLHEAWTRERKNDENADSKTRAGKSGGVAGPQPEDPAFTKAKEGILRIAEDPGHSIPEVPGRRKPRRGPKSGTG